MKTSLARAFVVSAAAVSTANLALAHPGHDDGHELTWELGHLAQHPLATLLCATVIAAATAAVWWTLRRASRAADHSLRGSQPSRGK
jgi:lysylphosphatidylglycerol synthetase-like protein (DUF2156 family)